MSFQRGDKAHIISGNNSGKVVEVVSVRPSGSVAVSYKNANGRNQDMIVSPNSLRVVFNATRHRRNRRGNNGKTRRNRRNRRGNNKTRRANRR